MMTQKTAYTLVTIILSTAVLFACGGSGIDSDAQITTNTPHIALTGNSQLIWTEGYVVPYLIWSDAIDYAPYFYNSAYSGSLLHEPYIQDVSNGAPFLTAIQDY